MFTRDFSSFYIMLFHLKLQTCFVLMPAEFFIKIVMYMHTYLMYANHNYYFSIYETVAFCLSAK